MRRSEVCQNLIWNKIVKKFHGTFQKFYGIFEISMEFFNKSKIPWNFHFQKFHGIPTLAWKDSVVKGK